MAKAKRKQTHSSGSQNELAGIKQLLEENLRYTKNLRRPSQTPNVKSQQELQQLLQENLKISKELHEMMQKINRWVAWRRIWGVVKVLIIVVPIVLGLIYLPPLIQKLIEPYQQFFSFFDISQRPDGQKGNYQQLIQQLINQPSEGQVNQIPE